MPALELPILLEPDALEAALGDPSLLVVDLGSADVHRQAHVPGAVHLEYAALVLGSPPVPGRLPELGPLRGALTAIGVSPERHVAAYDDEGGGRAARLLWTLEFLGHRSWSLLDGGLHAWANERHPLTAGSSPITPGWLPSEPQGSSALASKEEILAGLGRRDLVLLDARSPEEYDGSSVRALRGGHIPGAVNLNWADTMDRQRNLRLLDDATLRSRLERLGVTADKEVITYCQTHHRSAHSYVMLRHLAYPRVRGYAGSWSEWGNDPELPVER